jgi:NAD(P)-dependent dehydrogenase (short-subunit alcohol dehydrogenase family)
MSSNDMSTDTSARVWLITGASSGLGRSIAEAALAAGDCVVAAVRRPESLSALVSAHPGRVAVLALDVTDTAGIPVAVSEAVQAFGRIDVLVNSAGRTLIGAAEETTDRELRDLMDLHFFGPATLTREVLPHMRGRGSGAVVQISSIGGRLSFAGVSAYSASKFALEGLSESLAAEVAPFGIKVLIVEPGAFRTGLHGASMLRAAVNPAYDEIVGPVRAAHDGFDGTQPGDPVKAAAAVLTAEQTPLRLPLGNDAADAISARLEELRSEYEAWEHLTRATDIDA